MKKITKKLPKAQPGKIVKTIKNIAQDVSKIKKEIPKIDPRSGKPLSEYQIARLESGKKLDFLNVDGQNAKKALNNAIKSRTTKPKKLSYEDLVRKSYEEKNGGAIKSKMKKGGMIRMKKK